MNIAAKSTRARRLPAPADCPRPPTARARRLPAPLPALGALAALAALIAPPAHAQGSNWGASPTGGFTATYPGDYGPYFFPFAQYYGTAPSGNTGLSGDAGGTLTWQTEPASDPPADQQQFISVLVTAGVSGGDDGSGQSTYALDDGLGDKQGPRTYDSSAGRYSVPNYLGGGQESFGRHLKRVPVSGSPGGPWTATLPGFTITGTGTGPGPCVGGVFDFQYDTREASISSTLGQTYHKGKAADGSPTPLPDQPASDGTVSANSCAGAVPTITYSVHAAGGWAAGSKYLLHCASGDPVGGTDSGNTAAGQFTLPMDPICSLTVQYGPDSTTEHAYAHLTDYGDGADATANYYVAFHKPVEYWQRDSGSPIIHPMPTSGPTDPNSAGEWNRVGPYPNNGTNNLTNTFTLSLSSASSTSATVGGNIGGNLDIALIKGAFQTNESATTGDTYTITTTQSTTFTTSPGYQTYVFWGPGEEHRFGTCDEYAADGYQGSYSWYLDVPQTFGDSLAVRFATLDQAIKPI